MIKHVRTKCVDYNIKQYNKKDKTTDKQNNLNVKVKNSRKKLKSRRHLNC